MDVRYIVALSVTLLLVLPGAAAINPQEQPYVDCGGQGVSHDAEYASVGAKTGEDCGAGYDSDEGEIRLMPTFDSFYVGIWDYPYVTQDMTPDHISPAEGVEHPIGDFLKAIDATLAELGVTLDTADVQATDDTLVIQADDKTAEVEWPRNPRTGEKMIDDDRIYLPTSYRTSSDQQIRTGIATLRELCSTKGPESACSIGEDVDAAGLAPTVTVGYRVSNASVAGIPTSLPGPIGEVPATGPSSTDTEIGPPNTGSRPGPEPTASGPEASVTANGPGASLALPGDGGAAVVVATAAVIVTLGAAALYRRLTSEDVLDHPLRSEVFEYIKEHPGVTTQELSEALDVDYSTAGHHVSVLGDFDLIHAQSAGRVTHYFENHGTFDALEKEAIPLLREGTSAEIARIVGEEPRVTPSAIARELDVDPSTVKWHADKLQEAGVLESEPLDGRSIGFVVAEEARDVVEQWT